MWDIHPAMYILTPIWAVSIMEQDIITHPGMVPIIILVRSPTDTVYTGIPIPAGDSHLVYLMVG